MPDHEPTIHCPESISKYDENSVNYTNLKVTQSTLDGLNALIHYLGGFENGKSGRIPGHFELVMHYRALQGYDKSDKNYAEKTGMSANS